MHISLPLKITYSNYKCEKSHEQGICGKKPGSLCKMLEKQKKAILKRVWLEEEVSVDLFSRAAARQVFSALKSLTTVFGMGTGGPSSS